jgi:hypothetical protein
MAVKQLEAVERKYGRANHTEVARIDIHVPPTGNVVNGLN